MLTASMPSPLSPFTFLPSNISLDEMNPPLESSRPCSGTGRIAELTGKNITRPMRILQKPAFSSGLIAATGLPIPAEFVGRRSPVREHLGKDELS